MHSVADALRVRTLARVLAMPVAERIRLALSLGDDDLDLFVRASGRSRAEALAQLRASRAHGRRVPSGAAAPTRR